MKKKTSKAKGKERRIAKRAPIQVLVTCLKPGASRKGEGDLSWEMWARDLADDGVGLRWSRTWEASRSALALKTQTRRSSDARRDEFGSPSRTLHAGQRVHLEGLVYADEGSVPMDGVVQWVHASKDGNTCDFGVAITSPDHRKSSKRLQPATSLGGNGRGGSPRPP